MAPDQQQAHELQEAGTRIQDQVGKYGGARAAALAWLVAFLQEHVATYSAGDWQNRWWETLRFCRDGGLGPEEPRLSNLRSVTRSLPGRLAGPYDPIRLYPGPADREWMEGLQGVWLTNVQHYVTGGEVPTGDQPVNFKVQKGTPGMVVTVPNDDAAFAYQLIHLLAEFGPRLGQCRYCTTIYLAGRSDKLYCAAVCQAMQYKRAHPKTQGAKTRKPTVKGKTKPTLNKRGKRHGTKR
ncbi:MAG: hypothetical protein HOP32_14405 [Nitrospira sp.]|nr:hypothetical protein [Nitrospira sp.]